MRNQTVSSLTRLWASAHLRLIAMGKLVIGGISRGVPHFRVTPEIPDESQTLIHAAALLFSSSGRGIHWQDYNTLQLPLQDKCMCHHR